MNQFLFKCRNLFLEATLVIILNAEFIVKAILGNKTRITFAIKDFENKCSFKQKKTYTLPIYDDEFYYFSNNMLNYK